MKQEEMDRLQREIFEGCIQLREAGQKEYAQDINEAFANFHRGAHAVGIDRKQILWIYLSKHLDGITSAIKGHMSQREPVYGRIMDAIVYLTLLYGMFLEDEKHAVEKAKLAGIGITLSRPTPISTMEIAQVPVDNRQPWQTPEVKPFEPTGWERDLMSKLQSHEISADEFQQLWQQGPPDVIDHKDDLDVQRVDNLTGHNRPTDDRFGGASPHLGGYVAARRHRLESDNPNAAQVSSPDPNDWRP